ncbi:hypothetical protein [Brevundimonas sp. FT23028]|uniref:hypothetical protein n=1 Tax=Brevundimonas sp. FT23028 TaxID=3393748 RepID=UPI003B586774
MHKLSHREHARLARELVDACGGLEEAANACRVRKSALSGYQNPEDPSTMPADVMDALEEYAGQGPTYSGAIAERRMFPVKVTGCLKELAFDLAQESMDVVTAVREALADGNLSANDLDRIASAEREAEEALERVRAVRRSAENQDRRAA